MASGGSVGRAGAKRIPNGGQVEQHPIIIGGEDADNEDVPAKKRRGRRSRLSPALVDQLCAALRSGLYIETACAQVGLGETTYFRWMREAEEPGAGEEFRQFRQAVNRARAEAEDEALQQIRAAGARNWRAAAWWLERTMPHKYGRRSGVSGPHQEPIRVQEVLPMEEAYAAGMAALRQVEGNDSAPDSAEP